MAIGTAGYTAALCVLRLQALGASPAGGPVLVTGASGGVGSFAVALLAALGFEVHASTGKRSEGAYLKALGASQILDRAEFSEKGRPLGKERFAAAVDSVGGQTLANVLSVTRYGGAVAACGLAQGYDLPTTVMPFILRNVTLAGVDSVMADKAHRRAAWTLLTERLDLGHLQQITAEFRPDEVEETARALLAGKIRGRMVMNID
jgi:acrylyl-CoA reductase (NADPH)